MYEYLMVLTSPSGDVQNIPLANGDPEQGKVIADKIIAEGDDGPWKAVVKRRPVGEWENYNGN